MRVATLPKPMTRFPDRLHTGGQLALLSDDHATCRITADLTLQDCLDHDVSAEELLQHAGDAVEFDAQTALAPLPRATQFLDGSAYVNHVALVRQARGAQMPESFWTDPLMYQGCSSFLGPRADITGQADWGVDFEAEIAVITRAVPQGVSAEAAADLIAFVTVINDISLRNLIPDELSKGFGFVQSKPPCTMAPVALTPDALPGWDGAKLHGVLNVDLNGVPFGRADAGVDMTFDFGELIAHAAKTRSLTAGTVIGSGTVSNRDADGGPGSPVGDGGAGYSCIAEQRMVETIAEGAAATPFLKDGDRVKIWMEDAEGRSIFGDIDQRVRITT